MEMKYIVMVAWLLLSSLLTTIIDSLIGFHISDYNLLKASIINISRVITGFVMAWIYYHL